MSTKNLQAMLKSQTISLRAPELSDVDQLYEWENDESIWLLSNTITPFSRFALEQYILNSHEDIFSSRQLRLMIDLTDEEKQGIRTIGAIDLFDFDPANRRAGIGILIIRDERGKGYASKALDMVVRYAFKKLGLHQIYSNVMKGHESSLELFRKHNFEVTGLKKDWLKVNNTWVDEYLLQLINPEK